MPRIDSSLPQVGKPQIPAFREAMRRSPDNTANGLLPIAHALGAGFVTFCGVGLISIGVGWPIKWPLIVAGIVMLITMCLSGWWMVKNEVLWSVEKIFGDLNKDGVIGQPPIHTHFDVPITENYGLRGQYPIDHRLLIEWCIAAVNQQSLSHAAWDAKFAAPGTGNGRDEYQKFRDWLVAKKWAKEVGGNIGLRILWRNPQALSFVAGFAGVNPEDGTPLLDSYAEGAKTTAPHRLTHTRIEQEEGEGEPDEA